MRNLAKVMIPTFVLMSVASTAFAVGSSGFELATNSARSLAKANAVVADPEEPSTIVFNPAGLTKLEGNQVTSSTSVIVPITEYEGQNGGVSEDASVPVAYVPATFVSLSTPIKGFKVGFGANAPFGLQTHYESTGNFRYTGYFNEIITSGYNLSAAYEIAPWLSIGGGWTYLESDLKQVAKLNSTLITRNALLFPGFPALPDASFELDAEGHGNGWNAGLLLTPNEQHSIGLFYRSSIQVEYRGTLDVDDLSAPVMTGIFGGTSFHTSADTDITFPDSLTLGYRFSATKQWDIEVDVAWTNWSVFDHVDVTFGSSNVVLDALEPVEENFDDTLSFSVGTSYGFSPQWTVHAGYLYFERAANKTNYSNVIPDGDRHSVSFGLEYTALPVSVNVSYMLTIAPEITINNNVGTASGATVDGEYSSLYQIISFSLTYRF